MGKKSVSKSFVDCGSNPLPTDVELLVQIAGQTGHEYADAYTVWWAYHQDPDAYLIVDTVLWIAQTRELSVGDALNAVQHIMDQFSSPSGQKIAP
ncbi:hypothetical protein [Spirosoma areae]